MSKTNRITKWVYSYFRIVKSRNVAEVCIEIPLEQGEEFVQMFGMPNPEGSKWLAIAALNAPKVADYEDGMRAIQKSALVCKEKNFALFLKEKKGLQEINIEDESTVRIGAKAILGLSSFKELADKDKRIAFNRLIGEYESFATNDEV